VIFIYATKIEHPKGPKGLFAQNFYPIRKEVMLKLPANSSSLKN
jgi:hypothetical protein